MEENKKEKNQDATKNYPNPSAFPQMEHGYDRQNQYSDNMDVVHYTTGGMTLRDYFAAKALNGVCGNQNFLINLNAVPDRVAVACYEMADAMLKERCK